MSPATITLLFLLFAVVMFVWEKIPLGVTSMIVCVGLVITGVLDWKTAFSGFIDSNVILFVAMFIVGGALFETGMANKIGGVVTHFAKTERQLIIAIMVIVGLMSGVLSNTGTAAVLIPVVIGIAAKSGYSRSRLLMPLVFAAAMGGNLSLIGAPGNLIAQSAMGEIGLSFGFFEYAKVGLPILIAGILYFAFIGYKFLPEKQGNTESSYDEQKDFSNVPKWKQMMSLIILILTLLGMIFEDKIGIKLCVIGCVGALALIITGVISEKNALKSIDLKTIFLFGGTLSLAAALQETGAGEEIATAVIGILGKNPSPYVLTFVVFMLCCVHPRHARRAHRRPVLSGGYRSEPVLRCGTGDDPQPENRLYLPEFQSVSAPDGRAEYRSADALCAGAGADPLEAGAGPGEAGRARPPSRPPPDPALRRRMPAHRHRARPEQQPGLHPCRRTDRQP